MNYADYSTVINGHVLEFFEDGHIYLVDGVIIPSITQMLKVRFGNKYQGISRETLQRASEAGTRVHEAIETYCKTGFMEDLPEVSNFRFLQRQYKFTVLENETPVILFKGDLPISAGRLDLVLEMDGEIGGADIKRTSTLDKDYLSYQLNLYRIAYKQCYGREWQFLRGVHLREDKRKFITIPINESLAWSLVEQWEESNE